MTNNNGKTVVERYYEQFLDNPSVVDAIFAPTYVHAPRLSLGPNGVREERDMALKRFGDELDVSLHNLIAEGDLVVAEVTFTGKGEDLRQINWYRITEGQIIERWWVEGPTDFKPIRSIQIEVDRHVTDANKTVVRRYYEETIGNPAVADELFAADHVHYPGLTPGPDGVKQFMPMVQSKFGDEPTVSLDHLIAEVDLVAVDFTLSGQGAYAREMCLFRVNEGKIAARSCVYCEPRPGSRLCY